MRYCIYLICFIFLVLSDPARAQDDRYRVELIVLLHLNHTETAEEQRWLKDYSDALDFLAPEPEPDPESEEEGDAQASTSDDPDPMALPVEEGLETGVLPPDGILPDTAEDEPDPNAVVHIEEMSEAVQDAWRRLRLSGPFRPLQYLSWEQGRDEPFPVLRIHNDETVLIDDPYADLRALEMLEFDETLTDNSETDGNATDQTILVSSTADEDTEEATEDEEGLPDPTYYYALDGTASLLRKRFLHLYLDIQLREPVYDDPDRTPSMTGGATAPPSPNDEMAEPQATSFLVFSLEQNRQVRTGRMEYFDGPVIGVLAYISGVTLPEDETEE